MTIYNDEENCVLLTKYSDSSEESSSEENIRFIFELTPPDIEFKGKIDIGNIKWRKKKYNFYETINLYDYRCHYYFSKTHVLHLLDDLLGVDVIRNGDYYSSKPTTSKLELELGHDDQDFLITATVMCKKILSSNLGEYPFTRSLIFRTWENKELARIYLEDYGLEEDESTVNLIKETIKRSFWLNNANIKIRGKCSGYYEESIKEVSRENTYIQILNDDVKFYAKSIHGILQNLRKSLIQEIYK